MSRLRFAAAIGGSAMLFAASCTWYQTHTRVTQVSAGVLDINAFTASRSVLIHVQNTYPARVNVSTIIGNKVGLISSLATGAQQTIMMDPSLFPGTSFSLEVRPDTGPPRRLGPFSPSRGQTVNLIVAPKLEEWRVTIVPTTP